MLGTPTTGGGGGMMHYDAKFPVWLGGKPGVATVRVSRRRWAPELFQGWSLCLVGPLAIGLHLVDTSLPLPDPGPGGRTFRVLRSRDGVN